VGDVHAAEAPEQRPKAIQDEEFMNFLMLTFMSAILSTTAIALTVLGVSEPTLAVESSGMGSVDGSPVTAVQVELANPGFLDYLVVGLSPILTAIALLAAAGMIFWTGWKERRNQPIPILLIALTGGVVSLLTIAQVSSIWLTEWYFQEMGEKVRAVDNATPSLIWFIVIAVILYSTTVSAKQRERNRADAAEGELKGLV
jgi:hypothetical protein